MVLLGYEVYKFSQLPQEVRAQLKDAKPNSIIIKKIVQSSPIMVEWEIYNGRPSDWLMADFPNDD